jgi:hypothetical protein
VREINWYCITSGKQEGRGQIFALSRLFHFGNLFAPNKYTIKWFMISYISIFETVGSKIIFHEIVPPFEAELSDDFHLILSFSKSNSFSFDFFDSFILFSYQQEQYVPLSLQLMAMRNI